MQLVFQINGADPDPYLGVVEGYIQECINEISLIELTLATTDELSDGECADLIGKSVTIKLQDAVDGSRLCSRFDGVLYALHVLDSGDGEQGAFKYQAIVRPKIWDLNFIVRAKSFPDQSRVDVIEAVLKEDGLKADHDYQLCYLKKEIYLKQNQILQNHVSDLALVQHLMQEAGINYFFTADKSGDKEEIVKLSDNNIFFSAPYEKIIPHIPSSELTEGYCINAFETHFSSIPKTVTATANLGDGAVFAFTSKKNLENSHRGTFSVINCEGQEDGVAKHKATVVSDHFQANGITYDGRSNHFILRPGEKIKIGDAFNQPKKEVLLASVCHHFTQTVSAALTGDNHPTYANVFTAVHKNAEYRPDQTAGKIHCHPNRPLNRRPLLETDLTAGARHESKGRGTGPLTSETKSADEIQVLQQKLAALTSELAMTKELCGPMVGEVIEAARVTDGRELTCKVKNEKFPEGLTVKIALSWLTQQGWLSLLPRVGVQVYFVFMNGEGGQNEAVMIGYRPTANHPLMNPEKTTESKSLSTGDAPELGKSADNVVGSASFAPQNRYRNALLGENGVAEVAVIDGGEDSVYAHANNRICIMGDKSINISTGALSHSAGSLSEQLGSVSRGVKNDQKESITGLHEMSVGGDQNVNIKGNQKVEITKNQTLNVDGNQTQTIKGSATQTVTKAVKIESTDSTVDVIGKTKVTLKDNDGTTLELDGSKLTAKEPGGNTLKVVPDGVSGDAGAAHLSLSSKSSEAVMKVNDVSVHIKTDAVDITVGGTIVNIKQSGEVSIQGKTVNVSGDNVTIGGGMKVNVNGSGGNIDVAGGMVKIN